MNSRRKKDPAGEVERGEGGELGTVSGIPVNETRRPPETESVIYIYAQQNKTIVDIRDGYGREQNMAKR